MPEYYGSNAAGVMETHTPCDMHCPQLGTKGLNFWRSSCDAKRMGPDNNKTCHPDGCRFKPQRRDQPKQYTEKTKAQATIYANLTLRGMTTAQIMETREVTERTVQKYKSIARTLGYLEKAPIGRPHAKAR